MNLTIGRIALLASLLIGTQPAVAGKYDENYTGSWRSTDDVVNGWDWSLPPGVQPAARSGIFIGASVTGFPAGYPGNKLKKVDTTWRELEPSPGQWNFGPFLADLQDPGFAGAMVNIRSAVWYTEEARRCGSAASCLAAKNLRTAPDWICGGSPKLVDESPKGPSGAGFTQHNVDITQSCYKDGLIKLFREMKARGIPQMPEVKFVILHGSGDSKGEEWSGKQAGTSAGRAAMRELIDDGWVAAFSPNDVWKLGWPKATVNVPASEDLFYHCRDVGCGQRNSNTENWMIHFPKPEIGQIMVDANDNIVDGSGGPVEVYVKTDESNVFIRENRHFQDQNEQYQGSFAPAENFGTVDFFPLRYREATLSMLHIRRNVIWSDQGSQMNPKMLSWASLELGKNSGNAPDAWVQLMRTHRQAYGTTRHINNLERWLYQRDINGVTTSTTARQNHSDPLKSGAAPPFKPGGRRLPNELNYIDLARTGKTIGIAADNAFMSGGPNKVAIKVTYLDTGAQTWSLRYTKPDGSAGVRTVKKENTGAVRTATLFIPDFMANASGYNFDFTLESPDADTPFMFVRLIRLTPGSGGSGEPPPPGPPGGPNPPGVPGPPGGSDQAAPPLAPEDLTVVP